MKDMDRAAARVRRALAAGEHIAVYGDYDVDGITSTCLLTDFLRREGDGDPLYPRPDGGGLRPQPGGGGRPPGPGVEPHRHGGLRHHRRGGGGLRRLPLGVELVITDHHECKAALPAAAAVVDPRRAGCPYPFKCLAGVGVALKLVLALGGPARRDELLERYADLAAIGTVADVMSLTGENRTIVRLGLEALRRTGRPGLRALLHEAGLDERPLTATAIGYTLAPASMPPGGWGAPPLAGELLLTDDPARGRNSPGPCATSTGSGRPLRRRSIPSARPWPRPCPSRRGTPWCWPGSNGTRGGGHRGLPSGGEVLLPGVYDLPAGRQGQGLLPLLRGLQPVRRPGALRPLLEGFGGHALAAGFTIREENIPAFAAAMNDYVCACTGGEEMVSALDIDGELDDVGLLTLEGVEGLELLEPYGAGNPKPVFSPVWLPGFRRERGGRRAAPEAEADRVRPVVRRHFLLGHRRGGRGGAGRPGGRGFHAPDQRVPGVAERPAPALRSAPRPHPGPGRAGPVREVPPGEPLTRQEAEALLPSREEFVTLWRYLKGHAGQAPLEATAHRLARSIARSAGRRETVMRTLVCLEVFDERGLIRLEHTTDHLHIALRSVDGKVNLDDSCIMRKLRHILSNG